MHQVVPTTLQALHRFLTALSTSKNPLQFLAEEDGDSEIQQPLPEGSKGER